MAHQDHLGVNKLTELTKKGIVSCKSGREITPALASRRINSAHLRLASMKRLLCIVIEKVVGVT